MANLMAASAFEVTGRKISFIEIIRTAKGIWINLNGELVSKSHQQLSVSDFTSSSQQTVSIHGNFACMVMQPLPAADRKCVWTQKIMARIYKPEMVRQKKTSPTLSSDSCL